MKKIRNLGWLDSLLRILVGIILLGLVDLKLIGTWGWLGLLPFFSGIFRYCPVYSFLQINTYKSSSRATKI